MTNIKCIVVRIAGPRLELRMALVEEEKGRVTLPGLARGMVTLQMVQEVTRRAASGNADSRTVSGEMSAKSDQVCTLRRWLWSLLGCKLCSESGGMDGKKEDYLYRVQEARLYTAMPW